MIDLVFRRLLHYPIPETHREKQASNTARGSQSNLDPLADAHAIFIDLNFRGDKASARWRESRSNVHCIRVLSDRNRARCEW
jgi:hypothetical protein